MAEPIDPVQFCISQSGSLRASLDAFAAEIRRLTEAVHQLRETRSEEAEAVALAVIAKLAHDSSHGKPYWESGADHIGRRWYDTWTKWAGGWLTKLIIGAGLTAAIIWWSSTQGGHK